MTDLNECLSCGEGPPEGECPNSERACGHHCNHSWTDDYCHWCGAYFDEVSDWLEAEARLTT